jgi:hypothetical protein
MRPLLATVLLLLSISFACSDKKPTTPIKYPDQTPPAKISSLWICDENPTWADICWYAPGDDSLTGKATAYDIRFDQSPITDSSWDSCDIAVQTLVPRDPTVGERFRLTGLDSGVTYLVAIRAVDEVGNWSALSNVITVNEFDTLPPCTITDLIGIHLDDSTYTLQWTAPSDSGSDLKVSSYEIKYSLDTIDLTNWDSATNLGQFLIPLTPSLTQTVTFVWPTEDTVIYFAIRSRDASGNFSSISNLHRARNSGGTIIIPTDTTSGMDTLWTKECGTLLGQVPASMLATPDNGLVIASLYNWGTSTGIVVLRLDSLGNQVWETRLGGSGQEIPKKILGLPNGQFLVVGTSTACDEFYSGIYLARVDGNGNAVNENCFGLPGHELVTSAALCPDGGIVIVGGTNADVPEFSGFVLKTDPQGNELWRQVYTVFNGCSEAYTRPSARFLDVAVRADGDIMAFGRASLVPRPNGHSGGCDPEEQWLYFNAWSQTGEFVWYSTVTYTGWNDIVFGGTMSMLTDGSIAYTKEQASEGVGPQVCLFRPGGGRGWGNFLPYETDRNSIKLAPSQIANGVIVAFVRTDFSSSPDHRFGIVLLNNFGSQLAAMGYGAVYSQASLRALTEMADNCFSFAWVEPSSGNGRFYVTKARITTVIH